MIKLKTIRYFGSFYEYDGHLGWMPFWKVWITKIIAKQTDIEIKWVPQSLVKFD